MFIVLMVSTSVCGTDSMGSNPIKHPLVISVPNQTKKWTFGTLIIYCGMCRKWLSRRSHKPKFWVQVPVPQLQKQSILSKILQSKKKVLHSYHN